MRAHHRRYIYSRTRKQRRHKRLLSITQKYCYITHRNRPDRTGWPHPFLYHCQQAILSAGQDNQNAVKTVRAFSDGVAAYQRHPYYRHAAQIDCVWQQENDHCTTCKVRLLDYATCPEASHVTKGTILLIPSLVNQASIFDLHPQRSFARWLAAKGFRPLLLDWGKMPPTQQSYTLDTYYRRILTKAVQYIDGSFTALGYCLGGILATALARDNPHQVHSFVTLGTSWDYARFPLQRFLKTEHMLALLHHLHYTFGGIPMSVLQILFATLDPGLALRKFSRFIHIDPYSFDAHHFVAVEDWLNQGTMLNTQVARTILCDWALDNQLVKGTYIINNKPLVPSNIISPALIVAATKDRIAPVTSIVPLARQLSRAAVLRVPTGHIGMMVSRHAEQNVWSPVARFVIQSQGIHKKKYSRKSSRRYTSFS